MRNAVASRFVDDKRKFDLRQSGDDVIVHSMDKISAKEAKESDPTSPIENIDIAVNCEQNPQIQYKSGESSSAPKWSRRAFLGGAAALIAASCGRSDPTPAASPSPPLASPTAIGHTTYLPLVASGGEAEAVAVPPSLPTPTETPRPTSTPQPPTPTPTPVATPFPPGPPSKLGLFVGYNHPSIFELLETQAVTVVKTLELDANFVADIKRVSPRTRIIGRIALHQIDLAALDPIVEARRFVETLLPYADDPARRPYFDGWESYNEPVAGNIDEMARFAEFEAERTRLLGERGIRSVIGNFGTGQPPMEQWQAFLPAVRAAIQYDGWLGLHEYSAPTIYHLSTVEGRGRYPGVTPQDSGWLTLRYRKVYQEILAPAGLTLPLVMTELGVDGLVENRPGPPEARGWQEFQQYWAEHGYGLWGPGAYVEQLVWYDNAMRQDSYVIGGTIFALAPTAGWETYDIMGPCAGVLKQYLSVHAPV